MPRLPSLARVIVFALIVCGCSIEVDQPLTLTATATQAETPAASPASLVDMTQVPVTWSHLQLTGRLIYISSTQDGTVTSNVQMLDLQTGVITKLFNAADAWIYYATVSPDASRLIMSYAPPAPANSSSIRVLYEMPLDAASAPQLLFTPPTSDDRYTQAEWSPDGKYIYYTYYNDNEFGGQFGDKYKIFRMTYPAGKPELVAEYAFWPRLSSDASKLIYISIDPSSGRNELVLANANGSDPKPIPLSGPWLPEIIDAPIFSPDGQSILFSAPEPGQAYQPNWLERAMGIQVAKAHSIPSDWWSVPVSGGVPTQLTNIQTINLFASLSPDQQHIASVSGEGLFVMNLDGSNLTQLVSDSGVHGTVSWLP
jgi:Tol biopolymer transport system component